MLQKIIISVYSNLEMIIVQCVVSASIKFVVVQSGILMIDVVVYFLNNSGSKVSMLKELFFLPFELKMASNSCWNFLTCHYSKAWVPFSFQNSPLVALQYFH